MKSVNNIFIGSIIYLQYFISYKITYTIYIIYFTLEYIIVYEM